MSVPDIIRPSCKDPECRNDAEIAGWCPTHALRRYRDQTMRPLPPRYLGARARRRLESDEQNG